MFIDEEASVAPHVAARRGGVRGAAAARLDDPGRRPRSRRPRPRRRAGSAASTSRTARRWTSGRRPRRARASSSPRSCSRSSRSAISVCIVSDLAHQSVAAWTGEDTGGAENHVRAAAVFLSGAHPVKGDRAVRRPVRRPGRRAAHRPGHAAAVRRAVDRGARPELRRRLHLRLPQHALVEIRDAAAADGEQSAGRVRAAVRRRQHRRASAQRAATRR